MGGCKTIVEGAAEKWEVAAGDGGQRYKLLKSQVHEDILMEISLSHRGSWKFGAAGPMRHEASNCSVSVISTSTRQAPGADLSHLLPQTRGSPEASPARSFWRPLPPGEAAFLPGSGLI